MIGWILRATLHYGGEVHRTVKSFSPRHGYLRQGMVCQQRWKDNIYIFLSSWGSPEVKFLVWGFQVAQEPWPLETPLLKSVRHVGIHVIFSSMYNVLHQRTLGRSVKHHWRRVLLSANRLGIPQEFMTGGLLHRSVKRPLVFASPTGYMLTSFGFLLLNWDMFYKFL